MDDEDRQDSRSPVREYHQATKHAPQVMAPGPERLDWNAQPDPFRRFRGTWLWELPLARGDDLVTPISAIRGAQPVGRQGLTLRRVALLLEYSLGIAAWKEFQRNRWSLRCNPSSGNLHAEEAYVVCGGIEGLGPGIYHYVSVDHVLEQRASPEDPKSWGAVFPEPGIIIGLSSIYWREAWKYGARAFRYCQLDIGHAVAAVRYAAAALGWQVQVLDRFGDEQIEKILGLDREQDSPHPEEREASEVLLWCSRGRSDRDTGGVEVASAGPEPERLARAADGLRWRGRASRLSAGHTPWPQIAEARKATRKPETEGLTPGEPGPLPPLARPVADLPASVLFRQRRSGVEYDGVTGTVVGPFFNILDALVPRTGVPPWDALRWAPRVHPLFFVHRVKGLSPGLYLMPRTAEAETRLRSVLSEDLSWTAVKEAPKHIRLIRLLEEDYRGFAGIVSCRQSIAADSVFTVSMLAEFNAALDRGDWWYRYLHWEAGMLGHVLYLEAEAAGLRGTGIGCYFDDMMHELLGITTSSLQVLYHFAVGGPMEDERIATHPPYEHLKRAPR